MVLMDLTEEIIKSIQKFIPLASLWIFKKTFGTLDHKILFFFFKNLANMSQQGGTSVDKKNVVINNMKSE